MRRYRRNPHCAGRVVDGLAFVITPEDNKLHTLNVPATALWKRAVAPLSAEEAARILLEEFEIDNASQAEGDATACLEELVTRGILLVDEG